MMMDREFTADILRTPKFVVEPIVSTTGTYVTLPTGNKMKFDSPVLVDGLLVRSRFVEAYLSGTRVDPFSVGTAETVRVDEIRYRGKGKKIFRVMEDKQK